MSYRNDRYRFDLARPEDGPEILEILEDIEFEGNISLTFTRRPDPYASFKTEGRRVDILVGRDSRNDRLLGVAAAAVNRMFVNGEPADVGYVFGLRVRREYRRRYLLLPQGYQFLFSQHRGLGIPFYLTTILEENAAVQRLLEKKRPSMPVYEYCGDYETYALVTGRRAPASDGFRFRPAERTDLPAIEAFLHTQGSRFQFYPFLEAADLDGPDAILGHENFHLLVDRQGEIAAAGAVWDRRDTKQYVVAGYGGVFRLLRPLSFLFPLAGYPSLAKPGSVLNYFTLSFWAVRDNDPGMFDRFLRHLSAITGRFDYFVLGVHARHPLRDMLLKKPHILYKARMYIVHSQQHQDRLRDLDRDRVPYLEIGRL